MSSKVGAGKKIGEDSGSGKLLNEVEVFSKAHSLDKSKKPSVSPSTRSKPYGKPGLPEPRPKIKLGNEDPSQKEKKSLWNWKSTFSNVRNRRFTCCFCLQVGSIEGLPPSFNDRSVCVHWKLRDGGLVTRPAKFLDATAEFGEKTRDGGLVTRPAKVLDGTAEIEEKLTYTCSVYGSMSGSQRSAKYEAKHFLLYASVSEAPELDLGRHRVDFTRLLPLTLEELEEEKSSRKWKTSFKLSGKAKGATIKVSFSYRVIGDRPASSVGNNLSPRKPASGFGHENFEDDIRRVESHPSLVKCKSLPLSPSEIDLKDLHVLLPMSRSELASPVTLLYQNFDEDKSDCSVNYTPESDVFTESFKPIKPQFYSMPESSKENIEIKMQDKECSVVEKAVQLLSNDQAKLEEDAIMAVDVYTVERPQVVEIDPGVGVNSEKDTQLQPSIEDGLVVQAHNSKEDDQCSKESLLKDLEVALRSVSKLETELDSPEDQSDLEIQKKYERSGESGSDNLDEITQTVASEFLNMFGVAHSPFGLSSESESESPRERLLRQFEKDTLANGCPLFGFDMADREQPEHSYDSQTASPWGKKSEDFAGSSPIPIAKEDGQIATRERGKTMAKILEDLETEALMRKWGLNENAFQCSPPDCSSGFGSEVHLSPEELLDLPPLGEGLGPFLQTKNGGYLRSMNPSLFKNAKNGGSLIMQVSSPVVVPAEMGSSIMEILQRLASLGIEKLSMQANKVMPLEDITGKTMQQVAWEAALTLEGHERQCFLQHESKVGQEISGGHKEVGGRPFGSHSNRFNSISANEMGSEYVSLEDLAPMAMDKIEALSMEGLRIQSGMSNEEAPSNISTQSIGEISALQGKEVSLSGSLGLEGAAGLQLLDIKDTGNDVDGLMGLSLTLDEWMRLDSGEIDDEDQISEQTSKILAAHHANSLDFIRGRSKGGKRGKKCGLLGNNFTVALMVQLRDPLRNYEPVGAPMLAFIQVERVFIPPKPKVYCRVSGFRNNSREDDESESAVKEEAEEMENEGAAKEEGSPQFRITEVHLAGLKPETGNKKLLGSTTQQQSGSRWLLANGMGKGNKVMKSKVVPKPSTSTRSKVQPGDTLWSISSRILGTGANWKGVSALNPHIRNPNVIFPNETISLMS
ncbi:hypothetical protein SLEP1_g35156 [Rubroshorea leprosula]|uniref:Protein PLASTID MOVEMENT IMPAIRED 1-RELATED 1-like n=1 Tax=Rubroshorea leprosula TaxID=152421 RepID=A0AAV5KMC9_9ROSI|nr:hypothetical protein SLEP1_g35156 [Rubroshorea leprosula]